MTHLDDLYPSKFIKAGDLKGQDVNLTITSQTVEEVGKTAEKKPVLYFKGTDKGLILNRTNANTIGKAYGQDTSAWKNKRITLFGAETDFGGETVACIRIRPAAEPEMALEAKTPVDLKAELDDDVPF